MCCTCFPKSFFFPGRVYKSSRETKIDLFYFLFGKGKQRKLDYMILWNSGACASTDMTMARYKWLLAWLVRWVQVQVVPRVPPFRGFSAFSSLHFLRAYVKPNMLSKSNLAAIGGRNYLTCIWAFFHPFKLFKQNSSLCPSLYVYNVLGGLDFSLSLARLCLYCFITLNVMSTLPFFLFIAV